MSNNSQTIPFIPWWRVQYTEADIGSVVQAIRAEHLSLGPITAEFEAKLAEQLNVPYVVACTSGSVALLMALIAIGVGLGDEVIVPNRTWIAAAHAVAILGAKVIFVDVLPEIPNIDIAQIEDKITACTRAIIPTTLNGRAVNIEAIKTIAKKYKLHVIEDAAQALFSRENGRYMGTQVDMGCFSLGVSKLLPTGQGGFTVTSSKEIYQELIKIRTHGVGSLLDCHFSCFGFNFRYTDLQAAIGLTQLTTISKKIAALNEIYNRYEQRLKNYSKVHLIPVAINQGEVPLYIEVLCENRQKLMNFLREKQIQAKVFYPNLNRAVYLGCQENFINANVFESQGLTLPCGPDQSLQNIERVLQVIGEYEHDKSQG